MDASLSAPTCPDHNALFNIAATSGYYAQMTGLLAGFAFTALVLVLEPRRRGRRGTSADMLPLVLLAAFVSLIITTLTYSVLAGETTGANNRAASEELLDGLPFGLAVIMLFHGITILIENAHVDRWTTWTARAFSAVVAPVMTLYYLTNGVTDTIAARATESGTCGPTRLLATGIYLSITLAAVLAAALVAPVARRTIAKATWIAGHQQIVPIGVLVVGTVAALVAGDIATQQPTYLYPSWVIVCYLAVTFVLLGLLGLTLATGYAATDSDRVSDQGGKAEQPDTGASPSQALATSRTPASRVPSSRNPARDRIRATEPHDHHGGPDTGESATG